MHWKTYELPQSVTIGDSTYKFNADFRNILDIISIFDDCNLTKNEKWGVAMNYFYDDVTSIKEEHLIECIKAMTSFIDGCKDVQVQFNSPKLMDWEQDLGIIIPPINKVLGYDSRLKEFLHWWTFLGAYMEIGDCTFNTFVAIREKKARGKKLEKYEQKIYREHRNDIDFKQKYDDTTQAMLDEILGN